MPAGGTPEPVDIERLLNRRSDLSTFVVHLTKDGAGGSPTASENLAQILTAGTIEARSPMGWTGTGGNRLPAAALEAMKVVCFSETPLEHIYSLFQDIRGRGIRLSGYGLAFTRDTARGKGVNPVWYIDMTPGRDWALSPALDELRALAAADPAGFETHPASKILPFIEAMGTWPTGRKEFSWEREWRHLGDFKFSWLDVALVLCPEEEIGEFEALGPYSAVDPSWSLERMIATVVRKRAVLEAYVETAARRRAKTNEAKGASSTG
jgi:hypothetical protein